MLSLFNSLSIYDSAPVTIGSRVLFGPKVTIHTDSHSTSVQARRNGLLFARPVTIGDDCWICGNVVIVAGVTIGNGCTITAGSVVTHDIPPFTVARGNPAEVINKVQNPDDKQDFIGDTIMSPPESGPESPFSRMDRYFDGTEESEIGVEHVHDDQDTVEMPSLTQGRKKRARKS